MAELIYIASDGVVTNDNIGISSFGQNVRNEKLNILQGRTKKEHFYEILASFASNETLILYDSKMRSSSEAFTALQGSDKLALLSKKSAAIFFTSGTTGKPTAAFKTLDNILSEVNTHKMFFEAYGIKQVFVTVPLIHIYGYLFGMALPIKLQIDAVIQEEALPHDIIDICSRKPTLCVTNPVFIKAMLRLKDYTDLSKTLFISSTGVLQQSEAQQFEKMYKTKLFQLYGSTETGGIAIRESCDSHWNTLDGVQISEENGYLKVKSPYVSEYIFDGEIQQNSSYFTTMDLVGIESSSAFYLLGRSSELIKIGGKRLSVVEIETYLESLDGIDEALIGVNREAENLRGEKLSIFIVGNQMMVEKQNIKKQLHDYFGGIHFEYKIAFVELIAKTAAGKKQRASIMY